MEIKQTYRARGTPKTEEDATRIGKNFLSPVKRDLLLLSNFLEKQNAILVRSLHGDLTQEGVSYFIESFKYLEDPSIKADYHLADKTLSTDIIGVRGIWHRGYDEYDMERKSYPYEVKLNIKIIGTESRKLRDEIKKEVFKRKSISKIN
jgi:hypothetical protein